jgi:hypothetical protein
VSKSIVAIPHCDLTDAALLRLIGEGANIDVVYPLVERLIAAL